MLDTYLTIPKIGIISTETGLNMIKTNKIKPILKWAGGKTSELPIIHQYMPKNFDAFYEPFIGGGAVWLTIDNSHKMYVNDLSTELINLYHNIKNQDNDFYKFITKFNNLWLYINDFCLKNKTTLEDLYKNFKNNKINIKDVETSIKSLIEIEKNLSFYLENDLLQKSYIKYVLDKFKRTKNNEIKKGDLPVEDYIKNIETAFKASAYMFIRVLYNKFLTNKKDFGTNINSAIYFIIRDLAYSGMFRFNDNKEFNVPYGGMGYNSKDFNNKLNHMKSKEVVTHFKNSVINQGDFYDFMNKYPPQKNDFIFLDPPYDTEFSNYEGNEFTSNDQTRLADYLIKECAGKWMMVIKYTDFIYSLYNKPGIDIISFDKRYAVSFMDRNNQEVTHILIRNYKDE